MKIETVTEYPEFMNLRTEWDRLAAQTADPSVFLTHEWFSAWWDAFGRNKSLSIKISRDNHGLAGIAPLIESGNRLQFMASREVTDYCDFVIKKGYTRDFLVSLFMHFRKEYKGEKTLSLMNIPESSLTANSLAESAEACGFWCDEKRTGTAPVLEISGNFKDYLQSLRRKDRHELKRKARRMEKLPGLRLECWKDSRHVKTAVQDFIRLHKDSGGEKTKFWEKRGMTEFFKNLAVRLSGCGWAELNMLYLENKLIGSLVNFLYSKTLYFYNIAYHSEYSRLSPGIYLFFSRLKNAFNNGIQTADFLRGREKYKYSFGAQDKLICQYSIKPKENLE